MSEENVKKAISLILDGGHLDEPGAMAAMLEIMGGAASSAQIAALITALRMRGETVDEITGFAKAMRSSATPINPHIEGLVDTCGTGGDGAHTFNISTTAAFVVAGGGLPVAKHGNRAASSKCGSADVLEALGVNIALHPMQVEESIRQVGIGFLFAPTFHGAMKHAAAPRREIGVRTVFNVLGPLANPANAQVQVVGVYDAALTPIMAEVLGRLGVREALVVHGLDKLDELSVSAPTQVSHMKNGEVNTTTINPEEVGIQVSERDALRGGDAATNAAITVEVLSGVAGPRRDVVLLNAAAAFLAAGAVKDLRSGVRMAADVIDSGRALASLQNLRDFSAACSAA